MISEKLSHLMIYMQTLKVQNTRFGIVSHDILDSYKRPPDKITVQAKNHRV